MSEPELRELLPDFLLDISARRKRSDHTMEAYGRDVVQFLAYLEQTGGAKPTPKDFTLQATRAYVHSLTEENAPSSVQRKRSALSSFARFLVRGGYLNSNPAAGLRQSHRKRPRPLPTVYAEADVVRALDKPRLDDFIGIRDRALLEVLYGAGLRISELLNMRRADIHGSPASVLVTGKGSAQRLVPMSKTADAMLKKYLHARREFLESKELPDPGTLWLSDRGKPLTRFRAYQIVHRELAGVVKGEKMSPHVLRHCYATHLLDHMGDMAQSDTGDHVDRRPDHESGLRAVRDLLGHRSIATTEKYTHVSAERLREVYRKAHPHADKK